MTQARQCARETHNLSTPGAAPGLATSTGLPLFDETADICRRKHHRNRESEAANESTAPSKEALRARVLEYLELRGPFGATCEQIAEELDLRYTTCSARLSELKKLNLAAPTQRRRATSSGCPARVIVAAQFACAEVA
jgi:hypothetical protein